VGRAIVRQPEAFLFDEPLSNLDAKLRVEMRAELKALHRRLKTTTIYVTHDQEEAMTLGDRIVVMKDGIVQQVGSPLEVYDQPANHFVAGFVGTPPMNSIEGQLLSADGDVWFDGGDFKIRLPRERSSNLEAWVGKEVIMGIRPEAMHLESEGRFAGRDNVLPVTINVIEPLGEKMDVYAVTDRHPHIVARVDARRDLQADMKLDLHLDMNKIHIFATGDNEPNLTL
jgi:multiple sugar transport system ATP-binding protein